MFYTNFQPKITNILAFRYLNLPRYVNMWAKFLSRESEVFKIYTKYLSCLVYNQILYLVSLFVFISAKTDANYSEILARLTRLVELLLRESRLCYITLHTGRPFTSGLFLSREKKYSIFNLHVVVMPLE